MSPTTHARGLPPEALRDLHARLATVLADLDFPAQRWQLVAAADLYGVDTVTRSLIERAPEQRYQTLPELIAVLGGILAGRAVRPVPPTPAAARPVPPHAARSGVAPMPRVAHPDRRIPPRSPRPAA